MKNNHQLDQEVAVLMDKIKDAEKGHSLDLSSDEDLSLAVMNLISIEEHLFFTAKKTGDTGYYDLLFEVREQRKALMKMLLTNVEGEVWCTSKHLLAASMRCMEVGTKFLTKGDRAKADEFFQRSYDLYNLFWGLNLKLINKAEAGSLMTEQKKTLYEIGQEMEKDEEKTEEEKKNEEKADKKEDENPSTMNEKNFSKVESVGTDFSEQKSSGDQENDDDDEDEGDDDDMQPENFLSRLAKAINHSLDCCKE